jgi:hypothetical protein
LAALGHGGAEPNTGISNKHKPCAEQSWGVLGDGGADLAALGNEGADLAAIVEKVCKHVFFCGREEKCVCVCVREVCVYVCVHCFFVGEKSVFFVSKEEVCIHV